MGLRTVPVRCVRRIAAREKEETVRSSPMRSKPQEVQPARNVTVATVVAAAAGCLIKDSCVSVGNRVANSGVLRRGLESSATGVGWRGGSVAWVTFGLWTCQG